MEYEIPWYLIERNLVFEYVKNYNPNKDLFIQAELQYRENRDTYILNHIDKRKMEKDRNRRNRLLDNIDNLTLKYIYKKYKKQCKEFWKQVFIKKYNLNIIDYILFEDIGDFINYCGEDNTILCLFEYSCQIDNIKLLEYISNNYDYQEKSYLITICLLNESRKCLQFLKEYINPLDITDDLLIEIIESGFIRAIFDLKDIDVQLNVKILEISKISKNFDIFRFFQI